MFATYHRTVVFLYDIYTHVVSQYPHPHMQLLAPEIRHEQNTILQCIHYIIEKEFFDQDSSLTHAAGHKEIKDN